MNTYYVLLFRRWTRKRWAVVFGVMEEEFNQAPSPNDNTIAIWRTKATTKSEALGIVAEWLHRGKPSYMTVEKVWEQSA